MTTVRFGFGDFERMAKRVGAAADQIPYALAQSLNDAAEIARKELIEDTWPNSITSRNRTFMRAALTTQKNRATKKNLRVAITDKLGRGNLSLHADGGTKTAKGSNIAVPGKKLLPKRGQRGIPKSLRPRALPNSFKKGDEIYQRVGKKKRRLELAYTLRRSVKVKNDVPFRSEFRRIMREQVFKSFTPRLQAAMLGRKAR